MLGPSAPGVASDCPDEPDNDAPGDASIRVPCRTADGRIILVTMPRRALLRGGATGAALLASGVPATARARTTVLPEGGDPVAHLQELRRSLVRCDNLLGPAVVLDSVRDHLGLVRRLRDSASGADRRALLQVQAEYAEFCGWLHQDAGDLRAARYWTDRALEWAHGYGSPELAAYVLARKAQLACDMGDPGEAVDLADAARHLAPRRSRLLAMSATYAAHGHAMRGDSAACHRTYDTALGLVSEPQTDSPRPRGSWLDASYVRVQRAYSLSLLGRYGAAADDFSEAIRTLPPTFRRDRGVYLARAAVAQARDGHHEHAADTGLRALPIAAETGSARILGALTTLDAILPARTSAPEVASFRAAMDGVMVRET
jgi:hypothetical protein